MMKKKIAAILLTFALVISCLTVLASCGSSGLAYGKKYIYKEAINQDDPERISWYIFNANGTGTHYAKRRDGYYDYQFNFKYTFVDDEHSTVVCFYDGGLINNSNGSTMIDVYNDVINWSRTIGVSQNVILETNVTYVNEDYAKQLTNFNKSTSGFGK